MEGDKWNRCKYQCCLCDWITLDHRQIRIHIANQHQIPYNDYIRQYGDTEIVRKRFHCDLCKSEMKFCRQNIYAHMKDVHKMTLDEYEANVGMGRNGEFDGDENEEEIVIHGEPQTYTPVSQPKSQSGLLDDGRTPSRWNKCRFKCQLCGKLSSEKRHVREHIVKVHGLSLQEYESTYGSCEIHTEYFVCAICRAEVKHNLKNISLHLQNSHNMNANQYEEQYGRLPEQDNVSMEDFSFGAHFMLDDDGQEQYLDPQVVQAPPAPQPELATPSKADVQNPRNKHCTPCNREFNRRQAFVEHCRNVHKMNIKLASSKPATPNLTHSPAAGTPPTGGFKCDYCPKSFSNRSNKNRHMLLSCEVAGPNARNKEAEVKRSPVKRPSGDFIYDPQLSRNNRNEPQEYKCTEDGCEEIFVRSLQLKRHLSEIHNVEEKKEDEKKVPALRIKLPVQPSEEEEEMIVQQPEDEDEEEEGIEVPVEFDSNMMEEDDDDDEPSIPVEAQLEIDDAEADIGPDEDIPDEVDDDDEEEVPVQDE